MKFILASGSPRRREILTKSGYDFTVIKSDFNESKVKSPIKTASANAFGKAKDVFDGLADKENCVVLGSDTVVCFKGEILGKPKSKEDAINTLKRLSGKVHKVVTGYAVISEKENFCGYCVSKVKFNVLSDEFIKEYVDTGLPMDKAGSYGVQDGYNIVKSYKGSLNNVIGLPIEKFEKKLNGLLK